MKSQSPELKWAEPEPTFSSLCLVIALLEYKTSDGLTPSYHELRATTLKYSKSIECMIKITKSIKGCMPWL